MHRTVTIIALGFLASSLGKSAPAMEPAAIAQKPIAGPAEIVTVVMNSGRTVTGEITRLDGHYIWVRRSLDGATLTSRFRVEKVSSWQAADGAVPPSVSVSPATISQPLVTSGAMYPERRTDNVRSLRIAADVANWDQDAAADGLQVLVTPIGWDGMVIPRAGQITFKLLGVESRLRGRNRRTLPRAGYSGTQQRGVRSDGLRTVELGQWTERLGRARVVADGILFELPFSRFHPERDLTIHEEAVLTARLSLPGQGVFEATSPTLYLRPYSLLRDQLQLQTGRRYFSQEHRFQRN